MRIHFSNIYNFIIKTKQFGLYVPLSNLLLTYGGHIFPHSMLNRIEKKRNTIIQNYLVSFTARSYISKCKQTPTSVQTDNIWICWLQGEENMPEIPKLCLSSVRKYSNGHKVIVITIKNYTNYVMLPEVVVQKYNKRRIKPAHFADILRVNLLAQQGGMWLDATVLLTQPIPQIWFEKPFFTIKTISEGYYVSKCRWAVFCLAGKRNSSLFLSVAKAFELYLKQTDVFIDYFMFDHFIDIFYNQVPEIRNLIDEVPYNNPNVHQLNSILCKDYNPNSFMNLSRNTYMFKLSSYTFMTKDLLRNPNNYYNNILKELQLI